MTSPCPLCGRPLELEVEEEDRPGALLLRLGFSETALAHLAGHLPPGGGGERAAA